MTSPETLGKLSPICGQSVAKLEDGWGCPSNPLFLHSERGDSNPGPLPPQSRSASYVIDLWTRKRTDLPGSFIIDSRQSVANLRPAPAVPVIRSGTAEAGRVVEGEVR